MVKNDCFLKAFSKFVKIMEIKLLIQKERIHYDILLFEGNKMKGNFSEKAFAFSKIKNYAVRISPKNPKVVCAIEIIVQLFFFLFAPKNFLCPIIFFILLSLF